MNDYFFFFFFDESKKTVKKASRSEPDYEMLHERLLEGPVSFKEIEKLTGVAHSGVAQVITTLSLRYPIWHPERGIYKLIEESDYQTEI